MESTPYHTIARLVIVAPNWLGDCVMAQPAIADLRRAWPGATITVAARSSVAPVFTLMREIDQVAAPERLGDGGYDAAVLFPNSFRAALMAFRARIPERWGYSGDWRAAMLTRRVPRPAGLHMVEFYQQLVRGLGCETGSRVPRLAAGDARVREAALRLQAEGWDGVQPLIGLAPGAAFGGAKRWPPASFAEVARRLALRGARSVLVGSPSDADAGRALVASLGGGVAIDLIGRTDVPALAGVLANCRGVVANDSGAMHLAAALGVPVTVMFGPTDERGSRPFGEQHAVLTHQVWCRPCALRECPIDHSCMTGISVDEVAAAASRFL